MKGKQYNNKLDPKSATEGIRFANENAASLLADAQLLFDNRRFERCVALSILSIEESGKSRIIRRILLTDDLKVLNKYWREYRSHKSKNLGWIIPKLIGEGARKLEDFESLFSTESDHGEMLDNLKQLSFYTDVFSTRKWSLPKNVIDEDLANGILSIAKVLIKESHEGIDSEEGLKLLVKHMKPALNQGGEAMHLAIINCYEEAADQGIITVELKEKMIEFLK